MENFENSEKYSSKILKEMLKKYEKHSKIEKL